MSRVDEALRRAQRVPQGAPAATESAASTEPGTFESPWDLTDAAPSSRPTAPAAGDAAPPRTHANTRPGARPAGDHVLQDQGAALAPVRGLNPAVAERLVTSTSMRTAPLTEQFRRLAAALHHAQNDRGIHTVMVASALSGEGKTLSATNLALTLSESYQRRVLLIDADLRRPSLHDVFQIQNVGGLSDGLKASSDDKLALVQISPRLALLPAGRPTPDPMSLLTSERMRRILDEATQAFDWIIVDTPPICVLTDANLLATMVDAALLVVKAGATPYALVQRASDLIGRDRIIGVVLNGAQDPLHRRGYEYYEHYYRHTGGEVE